MYRKTRATRSRTTTATTLTMDNKCVMPLAQEDYTSASESDSWKSTTEFEPQVNENGLKYQSDALSETEGDDSFLLYVCNISEDSDSSESLDAGSRQIASSSSRYSETQYSETLSSADNTPTSTTDDDTYRQSNSYPSSSHPSSDDQRGQTFSSSSSELFFPTRRLRFPVSGRPRSHKHRHSISRKCTSNHIEDYSCHVNCGENCRKYMFNAVIVSCPKDTDLAKQFKIKLEEKQLNYKGYGVRPKVELLRLLAASRTPLMQLDKLVNDQTTTRFIVLKSPNYENDKTTVKIAERLTEYDCTIEVVNVCYPNIRYLQTTKNADSRFKHVNYDDDDFEDVMRSLLLLTPLKEHRHHDKMRRKCEQHEELKLSRQSEMAGRRKQTVDNSCSENTSRKHYPKWETQVYRYQIDQTDSSGKSHHAIVYTGSEQTLPKVFMPCHPWTTEIVSSGNLGTENQSRRHSKSRSTASPLGLLVHGFNPRQPSHDKALHSQLEHAVTTSSSSTYSGTEKCLSLPTDNNRKKICHRKPLSDCSVSQLKNPNIDHCEQQTSSSSESTIYTLSKSQPECKQQPNNMDIKNKFIKQKQVPLGKTCPNDIKSDLSRNSSIENIIAGLKQDQKTSKSESDSKNHRIDMMALRQMARQRREVKEESS